MGARLSFIVVIAIESETQSLMINRKHRKLRIFRVRYRGAGGRSDLVVFPHLLVYSFYSAWI
jgi:hypothetical protein